MPHIITLCLYANLREKAGASELHIEVPDSCTAGDLKTLLKQRYPTLAAQLNKVLVTVNRGQVFLDEEVLPPNAEVSILPPFGGG